MPLGNQALPLLSAPGSDCSVFAFFRLLYKQNHKVCSLLSWLLSFGRMHLRFIQSITCISAFHCRILFLYMDIPLFIHLLKCILSCFQFGETLNKAATDIQAKALYDHIFISVGYIYRCGISGLYSDLLIYCFCIPTSSK